MKVQKFFMIFRSRFSQKFIEYFRISEYRRNNFREKLKKLQKNLKKLKILLVSIEKL